MRHLTERELARAIATARREAIEECAKVCAEVVRMGGAFVAGAVVAGERLRALPERPA